MSHFVLSNNDKKIYVSMHKTFPAHCLVELIKLSHTEYSHAESDRALRGESGLPLLLTLWTNSMSQCYSYRCFLSPFNYSRRTLSVLGLTTQVLISLGGSWSLTMHCFLLHVFQCHV